MSPRHLRTFKVEIGTLLNQNLSFYGIVGNFKNSPIFVFPENNLIFVGNGIVDFSKPALAGSEKGVSASIKISRYGELPKGITDTTHE